jgi:hypothetical protein
MVCGHCKNNNTNQQGMLKSLPFFFEVRADIGVDIMGPLTGHKSIKYIIVVLDCFKKEVYAEQKKKMPDRREIISDVETFGEKKRYKQSPQTMGLNLLQNGFRNIFKRKI